MVNMGAVCRAAAFFLPALVAAQSGVVGTPSGFATGVTGGGDASPAAPSDVAELISWLEDETPRVILVDKEFNFIGTEGTKSDTGCRPDSNTCPDNGGQDAINEANWCSSDYPSVDVKYDQAAMEGINVKSNKSLVGVGDKGVLKGKGLRLTGGVENIIIQNVHITDLNPQYIWGGDAITLAGSDKVWSKYYPFPFSTAPPIGKHAIPHLAILDRTSRHPSGARAFHHIVFMLLGSLLHLVSGWPSVFL